MTMMLECNLELVGRVILFASVSKSTRKSTHVTRLCGVAQDLHNYCYHLECLWAGVNQGTYISCHMTYSVFYIHFIWRHSL